MGLKRNNSRTVSFRIYSDLEDGLRSQASIRGLSLNSYVTRILRRALELNPVSDQFELVQLEKHALNEFMQHVDDNDLMKIAHEVGSPYLKELGYALYGRGNLENLIRVVEFIETHMHMRPFSYTGDDNGYRFTIRHGLSRKWSIYSAEAIKNYVEDIGLNVAYEITDNAIMVSISPKKVKRTSPTT